MNAGLIRSMLTVIALEEETRESIPANEEELQFGYDEWREEHLPFVNSMYLLVMVSIWHYVERELVRMAARVGDPVSKISFEDYKHAITKMGKPGQLKRLKGILRLSDYSEWNTLDVLRLLANSYKHDPFDKPKRELLEALHLHLDPKANYRELNQSPALCDAFCSFLGLGVEAQYKDVARSYVDIAETFLNAVRTNTPLRHRKGGRVSSSAAKAER